MGLHVIKILKPYFLLHLIRDVFRVGQAASKVLGATHISHPHFAQFDKRGSGI